MFSTTLNKEYLVAAQLLDLDAGGVAELARQGVRYSFLDEDRKRRMLREIDEYVASAAMDRPV
jgi:adenosine deaminase/aminodeoxyfutalosine deaminase